MSDKIEQFWRDATADDVARVMGGEVIEARFRDFDSEEWGTKFLIGYLGCGPLGCNWIDMGGIGWKHCQVYDPPEILKNKPDPGKGFRLLEKFPDELVQNGDDVHRDGCWHESAYAKRGDSQQFENLWYRRRIEANNPEIPDSSTAANTIPSSWRLLGKDEDRLASDAYWSQGCNEWLLIGDDRVAIANSQEWHAIRQVVYWDHRELRVNGAYKLPGGQTIRITAKGFEVV